MNGNQNRLGFGGKGNQDGGAETHGLEHVDWEERHISLSKVVPYEPPLTPRDIGAFTHDVHLFYI